MRIGLLAICAFVLAACATATQPAALVAAGDAREVGQTTATGALWGANVVRVDPLPNQPRTVKLFGAAGGDPVLNGVYTYIAFFESGAEGWRVFQLGDVLDYRVLADSPGRVDLELTLSGDGADSIYGSHTRHVIVTWTLGENNAPPETISVTPAQQN